MLMKPIMEAVVQRPFIVITPCCESLGYVTNFSETSYDEKMESELEDVRKT